MRKADKFDCIKIITDNDLCISCGACAHICPFSNIRMEYNTVREKWDAEVKNTDICLKCDGRMNCLDVCLNFDMDYMRTAGSNENNLLGKITKIYNGYSTHGNIRFEASSGGFIRELCNSLFERREIDGVISIAHYDGLDYFPVIIHDVSQMPTSIYHNINYENAFEILKNNAGKYLLIGLPCQITSVEKLLNKKRYLYLKDRVVAKVSLICGHTFDRINVQAVAYYNRFELKKISYRGNGRYRKTVISNRFESKIFDVYNPRSLHELINNRIHTDHFLVQNGCLYCVDHLGYCADLVVGDAWQKRYHNDDRGTNIIISRNEKGEKIISQVKNFYFEDGFKEEIVESQGALYAYGSLGEGMKELNCRKRTFPCAHRTERIEDIKISEPGMSDLIKIRVIKKILRQRRFNLAKYLYVIIEYKILIRYVFHILIKNLLKK